MRGNKKMSKTVKEKCTKCINFRKKERNLSKQVFRIIHIEKTENSGKSYNPHYLSTLSTLFDVDFVDYLGEKKNGCFV